MAELQISPSFANHGLILELWTKATKRLENSRKRIDFCRQVRRNMFGVKIDARWLADAGAAAGDWLEVYLPERKTLDLNLTNTLGEEIPSLERVPLETTDTAEEDADNFEVWGQAALDESLDYDAVAGVAVQDGEVAVLVVPDRADMLGAPEYTDPKTKKPHTKYNRDSQRRPEGHPQYTTRHEGNSKKAWDEQYHRWLADNLPWSVRLISATDCVPLMVRGRRKKRWQCVGLVVRTLFEKEQLIAQDYAWEGMDTLVIPREHNAESTYGSDGMLYLYEAYLYDEKTKTPYCTYTVGGKTTWDTGSASQEAPIINFRTSFGIDVPLWDYFYFLHLEDDPDWRGCPAIWPVIPVLLTAEAAITSIVAAAWENSFGGHVVVPDPHVPENAYLDGTGRFKKFRKPKPGEVSIMPGPVVPFAKAETGPDIYKVAGLLTASLQQNTPQEGDSGSGELPSGHAQVVNHQLLESSKRQIRQGMLELAEFVIDRITRIACAWATGDPPKHEERPPIGVFVDDSENLPTGEVKTKTAVLPLNERWVSGNYRFRASFPKQGNALDIQLAANLAERGFGSDEDVYEEQGKKSTIQARVKAAEWKYINSPEGLLEYQIRRAQYRGDAQRLKVLQMIQQQKATIGGTPTSAIAPEAPGSGQGQLGAGMPNMDQPQAALAATIGGASEAAPNANDQRAVAQIGGPR